MPRESHAKLLPHVLTTLVALGLAWFVGGTAWTFGGLTEPAHRDWGLFLFAAVFGLGSQAGLLLLPTALKRRGGIQVAVGLLMAPTAILLAMVLVGSIDDAFRGSPRPVVHNVATVVGCVTYAWAFVQLVRSNLSGRVQTTRADYLQGWVEITVQEMRKRSYDEILTMAEYTPFEEADADRTRNTRGTYRELSAGGRIKVVVQAVERGFWGASNRIHLGGFWVDPSGQTAELAGRDFWDYT